MQTFRNQAALTYNGNQTTLSNIVTGNLINPLTITKNAVNSNYLPGDEVTFIINLVNSGNTEFTDLTLTDSLGAYPRAAGPMYPLTFNDGSLQYYVNGALAATPTVNPGPPLTITGLNVPAKSNVQLIYQATANQYAPLGAGQRIINTVTATGAQLARPLRDSAVLPFDQNVSLTITKALDPVNIVGDEPLTYTFTVQNFSPAEATAAENISVTDMFRPRLTLTGATLNGAPLSTDDYSYTPETGIFSTAPGVITVPAATYAQDAVTGIWSVTPGSSVLTVTGHY